METINEIEKLEQEIKEVSAQKKLRNIKPTCQNCKCKLLKNEIYYRCAFHNLIFCSNCLLDNSDVVKGEDGQPETRTRHVDCFKWILGKRGDCIMEKKVYVTDF